MFVQIDKLHSFNFIFIAHSQIINAKEFYFYYLSMNEYKNDSYTDTCNLDILTLKMKLILSILIFSIITKI